MAADIFQPGAELLDVEDLARLHKRHPLRLLIGSAEAKPPAFVVLDVRDPNGSSASANAAVVQLLRFANLGRMLLLAEIVAPSPMFTRRIAHDADARLLTLLGPGEH